MLTNPKTLIDYSSPKQTPPLRSGKDARDKDQPKQLSLNGKGALLQKTVKRTHAVRLPSARVLWGTLAVGVDNRLRGAALYGRSKPIV